MNRIELTGDELNVVRDALASYLSDFGHEQADLLERIQEVIAKSRGPSRPPS